MMFRSFAIAKPNLLVLAACVLALINSASGQNCEAVPNQILLDLVNQADLPAVATQYGLEEHIKGLELADIVVAPWQWQPGWKYELQNQ